MIDLSASEPVFIDSFYFFTLSEFSILLVTTCLLRGLFAKDIYHGTVMMQGTKTISCPIRATYYAKIT